MLHRALQRSSALSPLKHLRILRCLLSDMLKAGRKISGGLSLPRSASPRAATFERTVVPETPVVPLRCLLPRLPRAFRCGGDTRARKERPHLRRKGRLRTHKKQAHRRGNLPQSDGCATRTPMLKIRCSNSDGFSTRAVSFVHSAEFGAHIHAASRDMLRKRERSSTARALALWRHPYSTCR